MEAAYGKRDDGEWIENTGFVRRVIPDDHHGARHLDDESLMPGAVMIVGPKSKM